MFLYLNRIILRDSPYGPVVHCVINRVLPCAYGKHAKVTSGGAGDPTTALQQANETQSKLSQKVIRVFFSSPFGGLELEREELTKKHWPQLQSLCGRHGYTFVPVDLRWGITSDLSANASTIKICLSEIDRSNIFVGFFGQRYGWHGDDKLLQKTFDVAQHDYPWLAEYRGKAVTELEFLHGHLRNPGRIPACFYFRDKGYDDKMLAQYEAERNEREMRKYRSITDGPHAAELLDDLKKRVYETRDKCIDICISYKTPEEAAKMMFNAVNAQIKKMLATASDTRLSPREMEKSKHDVYFVKQYSIGGKYIGGDGYQERMDQIISSSLNKSCKIAVIGKDGIGKTALLCNWIDNHSKKNPDDIIVYHFIGCATDTTDPKQILSRIYEELEHEFQKTVKPAGTEQTAEETAKASASASENSHENMNKVNCQDSENVQTSQNISTSNKVDKNSSGGIFSCFRGRKVADASKDDAYEKARDNSEQTAKDEKQTEKDHDTAEEKSPPTISNKKFSPKDLLPKGGGNHSIQKILGNIAQLTQKISEAKKNAFIVIDALNKTDDIGKTGKVLYWLPNNLPANVHSIVSTRTEHQAAMDVLVQERSFDTVEISSLNDEHKVKMAKNMLALRGKEFSEQQMMKVTSIEQTRNPLYLEIFLEEMCSFGDFFLVDKQIDHLLKAESTKVLFLKFIERMESDYNPKNQDGDNEKPSRNVVKEVLCLIEVSKEGLSEEELRAILHIDSGTWSPIFFAMASFILDRAGLYSFAYEDLSMAVNEYYFKEEADKLEFVEKLSNYFEEKFLSLSLSVDDVVPPRISSEYPRLLSKLDDSEKLAGYLTKLCVLASIASDSPEWFKMMDFWQLTGLSNDQISQKFLKSIDEEIKQLKENDLEKYGEEKNPVTTHEKLLPVLLRIATFMVDSGYGKAVIPILLKAKELYGSLEDETTTDLQKVDLYCNINYSLACLYVDLDTLDEAEPVHQDVLNVRERYSDLFENGDIDVATSLFGLSVLEGRRKNYDKVDEYNTRILAIYDKRLPSDHEYYGNLYNNWGVQIMSSNTEYKEEIYEKAIEYMNKAQKIYESVYFGHLPPQVTVILNNLALCNRRLGKNEEARELYKRVLAIRIDTLGENHTNVGMVYRNLGTLEFTEEKYDLALDYYEKSLKIYEAFGEEHLETALSLENMALVKMALKDWDEAHYYFNKAGEILVKTERMDHSSPKINAIMADHYLTNDREQDAYKLFQRLVGTSIAQPRDYAALEYFDRQLPENERPTRPYEHSVNYALEKWPDNEMLLRNKINSLSETGDIDKMMEYLSKAKTCSVDIYLSAYSSFVEKGHIAIAMPLLKEGLSHYPENQNLLRNMVELSLAFKDYNTVIQCTEKLLTQDPNELFALIFLGRAQALNGDLAGSKETFTRGLSLAQQNKDEENTTKFQNFLKMLDDAVQ